MGQKHTKRIFSSQYYFNQKEVLSKVCFMITKKEKVHYIVICVIMYMT